MGKPIYVEGAIYEVLHPVNADFTVCRVTSEPVAVQKSSLGGARTYWVTSGCCSRPVDAVMGC